MEVVLQNNLILIRTDFQTLNQPWMRDFLTSHAKNMLFLPRAVLVFQNHSLLQGKIRFLKHLASCHAKKHDLQANFFKNSLVKIKNHPIKVELLKMESTQKMNVELYAWDKHRVDISLYYPNSWVMSYLRSQFGIYVIKYSDSTISIDISGSKAKMRLERALNKRHILHYEIEYRYDEEFMQRLYSDISFFDCEEHEEQSMEKIIHFHTVLECPVGASQDILKKSYKKLARVYHPDRIFHKSPQLLSHYTQKFQLLQEAYSALKIVS